MSDAFDKATRGGTQAAKHMHTLTHISRGGGGPSADVTVQTEIAGRANPLPSGGLATLWQGGPGADPGIWRAQLEAPSRGGCGRGAPLPPS